MARKKREANGSLPASSRGRQAGRNGVRDPRHGEAQRRNNRQTAGATVGYEAQLWQMADALRGSMSSNQSGEGEIRKNLIEADLVDCMVDRTHRELTDEEIQRIAGTYHAWRGDIGAGPRVCPGGATTEGRPYADIPEFCKSVTLDEIRKHGYVLTPGRYVGAAPQEEDDESFEGKMNRLVAQLREQQAEAAKLDEAIAENLKELGYGK